MQLWLVGILRPKQRTIYLDKTRNKDIANYSKTHTHTLETKLFLSTLDYRKVPAYINSAKYVYCLVQFLLILKNIP